MNRDHVVQDYIAHPIVMDGFKFDLRLYVLVLSIEPLRVSVRWLRWRDERDIAAGKRGECQGQHSGTSHHESREIQKVRDIRLFNTWNHRKNVCNY